MHISTECREALKQRQTWCEGTFAMSTDPFCPKEYSSELGVVLEDMGVPLAGLPPVGIVLNPSASGTAVQKNDYAEIDYSNAKDGYVMVKWKGSSSTKVKVLVWGPGYLCHVNGPILSQRV